MLFAINSLLQGLKRPIWAFWIGLYRQGVAVPLFIYVFVRLLGYDVIGVWYGIATSVLSGLVLSVIAAQFAVYPLIGWIKPPSKIQPAQ